MNTQISLNSQQQTAGLTNNLANLTEQVCLTGAWMKHVGKQMMHGMERVMRVLGRMLHATGQVMDSGMELLCQYFSDCLEREVSRRQAGWLLHAQVAFVVAAFGSGSLWFHIGAALWLGWALLKCRQSMARWH